MPPDLQEVPQEFLLRFKAILPQAPTGIFQARTWQTFRINTLKIPVEEAKGLLVQRAVAFEEVPWCSYAVVVARPQAQDVLQSDLVSQGLLYAQGLETLLPVLVLDPQPGERVLDLCAAPGGKTSQIAMHMRQAGFLAANEPVRDRFYKLKSVLELMGVQARLSCIDGRRFRATDGLFDRVLVDAPCSSEGRFQLGVPKTFAYWSLRKIKEMSHKQKGLLLNASRLMAPKGSLVYATCTFAPEENEETVDWLLRKTELRLEPVKLPGIETYPCLLQWGKRIYEPSIAGSCRILPNERMEGFFIAKFVNSHYK